MKSRIMFLVFAFTVITVSKVQAQMDTWMLNQWLNEMNANTYQQEQQLMKELGKAFEAEKERQKSQATAVCSLLPNGNDTFFAYVTLLYLGKSDVELIEIDYFGDETLITPSSYSFINGTIITSAIFTPGTKVVVRNKNTGRILSSQEIPEKDTPQYQSFVRNGYSLSRALSSQSGNVYTGDAESEYNNTQGASTVKSTCSLCGGKGWIAGSSTPTYGNSSTHWCTECARTVGASHSHNRCPSCSGLGYIKKIQ